MSTVFNVTVDFSDINSLVLFPFKYMSIACFSGVSHFIGKGRVAVAVSQTVFTESSFPFLLQRGKETITLSFNIEMLTIFETFVSLKILVSG